MYVCISMYYIYIIYIYIYHLFFFEAHTLWLPEAEDGGGQNDLTVQVSFCFYFKWSEYIFFK